MALGGTKLFAWQLSHLRFIFPQLFVCFNSPDLLYPRCPPASAIDSHMFYLWTGSLEVHFVYSWILFVCVCCFVFCFFFPCSRENPVLVANLLFLSTAWYHLLPDVFLCRCQWFRPIWNWHLSFPHMKRSACWKVSSSVHKTQVISCVLGICCPTIRLLF